MRFILTSIIIVFVCNVTQANICGTTVSKFVIPDYACFDAQGNCIPYAKCGSKQSNGLIRQKVDFTKACSSHDACYDTKGKTKVSCDIAFYKRLKKACRDDIKGSEAALRACVNVANDYNDVVRGQLINPVVQCGYTIMPSKIIKDGCDAYINAQKKAGVENPSCQQESSSNPMTSSSTEDSIPKSTDVESNSMINIDWPTELKISCESKKPAFTDIVISVNGLDQKKSYTLWLRGYNGGSRFISHYRNSDPKMIYRDAYSGEYLAEVWFEKGSTKNQKLVASKSFTITRPELKLTAPEKIAPNTPFEVALSNVIAPKPRYSMHLTVVPKYYQLNKLADTKRNLRNCEPINHTFKGLSTGQYEIRLLLFDSNGATLLASKEISVGGAEVGVSSSPSTHNAANGVKTITSSVRYGDFIGEYRGVIAKSNGECTGTFKSKCADWLNYAQYQCVDFVKKFYSQNYPKVLEVQGIWQDANTFWNRKSFSRLVQHLIDGTTILPKTGDMLFFDTGYPEGHVAIVTEVRANSISLIQQNIKRDTAYATINYKKLNGVIVFDNGMQFPDGSTTQSRMNLLGWLSPN